MALKSKLSPDELALLEVIEDEIWLGEFLRNTAGGEVDKALWPKRTFKYRWYQRDFLTDKTEFIVLTGGRAIGKCSPGPSRVYTLEGYQTLSELAKKPYFVAYALTPEGQVVQRRAIVVPDRRDAAFTIVTESGHKFVGTGNHPVLTTDGYKLIQDITLNDLVAVVTSLPHESYKNAFSWAELRWLGYTFLNEKFRPETPFKLKNRKQRKEVHIIADKLNTNLHFTSDGVYTLKRKMGIHPHSLRNFLYSIGATRMSRAETMHRIPAAIKTERYENLRVFLEAVLAQFAELQERSFALNLPNEYVAQDFQELFLKFDIETRIVEVGKKWRLEALDYRAAYRMWTQFNIPGYVLGTLPMPPQSADVYAHMRFDKIVNIYQSHRDVETYAVQVHYDENYIGDNLYVHNSIVLEDKLVFEIVNNDLEFPVTPEETLVTANQSQMTPLLDKIRQRFTVSPLLKDFLNKNNKSTGTMDFAVGKRMHRLNARIAGSRGENNMVGLHTPRIRGDEMQLFPLTAFTQLEPTYNSWEPKRGQVHAGVPNGLRNSVLYILDQRTDKYKKYRVPAHNNPYFRREDNLDAIKRYGGEQDDRYQQLILGRHGAAAFQVIPRETIKIESFPFYSYRYSSSNKLKGETYQDVLKLPKLPDSAKATMLAIDTGFVDATVIQLLAVDENGIWRTYIRYRLTRIDFNEQQQIINYISDNYNVSRIAIDIGAGGGGAGIMHNLLHSPEYNNKYKNKIIPIQFKENITAGIDENGEEIVQEAKSLAVNELAKMIEASQLVFSDVDNEGISQIERIAQQKQMSGKDTFFVLSERGAGPDKDDHIFASYVCYVLGIRQFVGINTTKKLAKATGTYSK